MNQMFAAVTGKRSRDFYEHFFKTVLILWAGFTLLLGIFFHDIPPDVNVVYLCIHCMK